MVPALLPDNFEINGCWEAGVFQCAFGEIDLQDVVLADLRESGARVW